MSRDMRADELAAWKGLIEGDIEPLADLLEAENSELHPIVQRWLWKLIRGSPRDSDYRLKVCRHPELTQPALGIQATRRRKAKGLPVALAMFRNGALEPSQHETALAETMEQTGLSRSTVEKHWSAHKGFIRFSVSHGLLKPA